MRSANQKSPIAAATDVAATWAGGDQRKRRASSSSGKTAATSSACPSSIPTLKLISDASRSVAEPVGEGERAGEPEPVQQAEGEHDAEPVAGLAAEDVLGRDVEDRERDQRLDDLGRDGDPAERAEREREAVRGGERGRDLDHAAQRLRAQQQREQEQHVVEAREDVLDAHRHEARHVADERALAGRQLVVAGVEDVRAGGAAEAVVDDAAVVVDDGAVGEHAVADGVGAARARPGRRSRAPRRGERLALTALDAGAAAARPRTGRRRRDDHEPVAQVRLDRGAPVAQPVRAARRRARARRDRQRLVLDPEPVVDRRPVLTDLRIAGRRPDVRRRRRSDREQREERRHRGVQPLHMTPLPSPCRSWAGTQQRHGRARVARP